MAEMRKVVLTLVVELYQEQKREEQDRIRMFELLGAQTHRIPTYYCCFDPVNSIWDHIGWRLCAGRLAATAAHMQSHASHLCGSIQEPLRIRGRYIPDGEPIQLTFILQLSQVSPGQDAGDGLGASEPTRTVPASKSSVQSLKRKRAAMDDNGDDPLAKKVCVICQDEFGKEGSLAAMPCDHEFHEKCIVGWLDRAHSCPLCRFQLPPIDALTNVYND